MQSKLAARRVRSAEAADGAYNLTSGDLARTLHVDLKTIHNWVNQGHLAGRRTQGRHLRFRRTEVVRFMRRFGYPVPDHVGTAPARVLVTRADGAKTRPIVLGRGIRSAACEGLFNATIEVVTGQHEIVVIDLDTYNHHPVFEMIKALRHRPSTCGIPLVGMSRNTSYRRSFIDQGGDAALAQKANELTATVRWLIGSLNVTPDGVTLA